ELRFINKTEEIASPQVIRTPGTDLSYLTEFCEGDQSKMQKYINIFLESVPVFTQKLETALDENNYEEIASQVHGFKTKFVMMGMDMAKELAVQLEADCRMKNSDQDFIHKNTLQLICFISDAAEELKNRKKV